MQHAPSRWRHRHLVTTSDWLGAITSFLVAAAILSTVFMSTGTSCTTTMTGSTTCQSPSVAQAIGLTVWTFTPLVLVVGLGVGWVFFRFRHVRALLVGFGAVAIGFYVLSFGLDWVLVPAGLTSLLGGLLLSRRSRAH